MKPDKNVRWKVLSWDEQKVYDGPIGSTIEDKLEF